MSINLARLALAAITIGFLSCSDDDIVDEGNNGATTVVQFELGAVDILEDAGEQTVRLSLSRPLMTDAVFSLKTGTRFGENFTTTPPVSGGLIQVGLLKGQTSGEIKLTPLDNNAKDGHRVTELKLHNLAGAFIAGANNTIRITLQDDESPGGQESVANFISQEVTLDESYAEGVDYQIHFSKPVPINSSIRISLTSANGGYGVDFHSAPEAEDDEITVPVVAGSSVVSFKLMPLDNQTITGELKVNMTIIETGPSISKGNTLHQTLTIKDDELAGMPRGYEVTAGSTILKKYYEYDSQGRIAKVNWQYYSPYLKEGIDTYFYNAVGQIERINKGEGRDVVYRRDNDRIVRSETIRNGLVHSYTDYEYDDLGHVGLVTLYYRQNDASYLKGMYTVYLYFTDGNLFKSLTYQDNADPSGEPYLLSTKTYDQYMDIANPFDMVELLPGLKMQTRLATTYRIEESGLDRLYQMTYEFREDGLPEKRISTAPGDMQTSVYYYY